MRSQVQLFIMLMMIILASACSQNKAHREPVYVAAASLHILSINEGCEEFAYFQLEDGKLLIPQQGLVDLERLSVGTKIQLTYKESKNIKKHPSCIDGTPIEIDHIDVTQMAKTNLDLKLLDN